MARETSIINLGYINLSNKVVVSDPCYPRGTWCMFMDMAVKPGRYAAFISKKDEGVSGIRVASLIVVHTDFVKALKVDWEPYDGYLGENTGQCGIFDNAVYPAKGKPIGEYGDLESFYGECCNLTFSKDDGGILKNCDGIVSASGYGDGSYKLCCQYHDGERIALMIDYYVEDRDVVTKALLKQLTS